MERTFYIVKSDAGKYVRNCTTRKCSVTIKEKSARRYPDYHKADRDRFLASLLTGKPFKTHRSCMRYVLKVRFRHRTEYVKFNPLKPTAVHTTPRLDAAWKTSDKKILSMLRRCYSPMVGVKISLEPTIVILDFDIDAVLPFEEK